MQTHHSCVAKFIFIISSLVFTQCAAEPAAEMAAYGDSVTWGYGGLPGGWVSRLETLSGYSIANLGVPGEIAEGGAKRIKRAMIAAPNASVVLVIHGGNDWVGNFRGEPCLSGCEPETIDEKYENVVRYLRDIRDEIKDAGKKIVYGTYWPNSAEACNRYKPENYELYQNHRRYLNDKIRKVADEGGDHVVWHEDMAELSSTSANYFDCLHPSEVGYDQIAARWIDDFEYWKPESSWEGEF